MVAAIVVAAWACAAVAAAVDRWTGCAEAPPFCCVQPRRRPDASGLLVADAAAAVTFDVSTVVGRAAGGGGSGCRCLRRFTLVTIIALD